MFKQLFDPIDERKKGILASRFLMPPFSVLNARDGFWQKRKRMWIALGIKSEEGRVDDALGFSEAAEQFGYEHNADGTPKRKKKVHSQPFTGGMEGENGDLHQRYADGGRKKKVPGPSTSESGRPGDLSKEFKQKLAPGGTGKNTCWLGSSERNPKFDKTVGLQGMSRKSLELAGGYLNEDGTAKGGAGTSVFDPVLCELMYRWFCPDHGHILDPFAGGSVRGIVATTLGYRYTGVELRREQIIANDKQAKHIKESPTWILGDSSRIGEILPEGALYDFIWSCPPYYDLEVYSNKDADGSAKQTYPEFMVWYRNIFRQCIERLKNNRFLAVVVGEIRDKTGPYNNL